MGFRFGGMDPCGMTSKKEHDLFQKDKWAPTIKPLQFAAAFLL